MEDTKFLGFLGGIADGSFTQEVAEANAASDGSEETYLYYEKKLESGELIPNVVFSQHEKTQGLYFFENGVKILMANEDMKEGVNVMYSSAKSLNRPFTIKVMSVDRINKVVRVSFKAAQEAVRPEVIQAIEHKLQKSEYFYTEARVMHIKTVPMNPSRTYAILDIMGVGIGGIIMNADWSEAYVRSLEDEVKVGDVVNVAIVGKNTYRKSNYIQYRCSRKIADKNKKNAWVGIEERFPLHSNLIVTCVHVEKEYWLGRVKGLDDITAYGHYPEAEVKNSITGDRLVVTPGVSYKCYVSAVSEVDKKMRVRCIDVLPAYMQK